jgi:predicted transcriptional regulator
MKTLAEVQTELGYTTYTCPDDSVIILNGYTSDLLSDVMGNASEDSALITIQAHKNTVAVASLIGIKAIILCNGRTPTEDMIAAAQQEQIAILGTSDNQFTVSYRLAKVLGIVS